MLRRRKRVSETGTAGRFGIQIERFYLWRLRVNGGNSVYNPNVTLLSYGEGVSFTERHRL
jgi:hypothetical protein